MSKKRASTRWNIPVPKVLDEALEEAVEFGMHATKADLVRDAVRRTILEMGFKARPFEGGTSSACEEQPNWANEKTRKAP